MRPLQDSSPPLGPTVQEGCGKTGEEPAESRKIVRDLKHSAFEGRELDLGSQVRRQQRGHLPGAFDCWKGSDRHESKIPASSGNAAGITTVECSLGGPEVVLNNRKF